MRIQEVCEGKVLRTFFCIHDPECDHWMSGAAFDGEIWTKKVRRRREFASEIEAECVLDDFHRWRTEESQLPTQPVSPGRNAEWEPEDDLEELA